MILQSGTLFFSFLSPNRKGVDWLIVRLLNSRKETQDFLANQREGKKWLSKDHYRVICCFWTQSFNLHYPWSYTIILERIKWKANPLFSQNYDALSKPNYLPIPHPWLGEEGEGWAQFSVHSGTSPLGQLHSRDTKFGPGKMFTVFVFVVLYWRDSFIQGKGTLFLGPETWL